MVLDEEADRTKESVVDMGSHLSTAQPLTGQRRWGAMAKIVKISCKAVILCGSSSGTCTCALQKKEGCEVSLAVCRENRVNERRSQKMGFKLLREKCSHPQSQ